MPDDRPRVVLEKSRTVRRRYQRSNKRFQFTASQIERIEREEEREKRAQKLRDKEKKRVANRKRQAEKESRAREERLRLGLPDLNAPSVPSSQPLLFNFIKKPSSPSAAPEENAVLTSEDDGEEAGPGNPSTESTEVNTDIEEESDLDEGELDEGELESVLMAAEIRSGMSPAIGAERPITWDVIDAGLQRDEGGKGDNEDEFSDCSIFDNKDAIKEIETTVAADDLGMGKKDQTLKAPNRPGSIGQRNPRLLLRCESFQDDTAAFLDEFGHDFNLDEEFKREPTQLDGV